MMQMINSSIERISVVFADLFSQTRLHSQKNRAYMANSIAIFKNSANQNGIFAICSLRMLLVHEKRKLL